MNEFIAPTKFKLFISLGIILFAISIFFGNVRTPLNFIFFPIIILMVLLPAKGSALLLMPGNPTIASGIILSFAAILYSYFISCLTEFIYQKIKQKI